MLYTSPLELYADSSYFKSLKMIQLRWENKVGGLSNYYSFRVLNNGVIENVQLLLEWINKPLGFDAPAMSRIMSARDENNNNLFHEGFINYLQRFHFAGAMWLIAEGIPVFAAQPILLLLANSLEIAVLQFWIEYLIKPNTYLVKEENVLQIRRFYDASGQIHQDLIFSPDTPPIVNFEAASWEDLLHLVFPAGEQS